MSLTRVYLPLTAADCRVLSARRLLSAAPLAAHAVTRALEVSLPGAEMAVYEHQALQAAAREALDGARTSGERVVVAAADVDSELVEDRAGQKQSPSVVRVTDQVALPRIASFHLADPDAALTTPDEDSDLELSWYDATELGVVLELL